MKKIKLLLALAIVFLIYSCSNGDQTDVTASADLDYEWIVPLNKLSGSFNPFPLAENPILFKVSDANFISDNELVAIISFNSEIRVYPYQYISTYESINDIIDGIKIAMTYCPITQSALCWNSKFKGEDFVLRASGYLHNDNVVLYDEQSDTYWSQMLSSCIKGKYAKQDNATFNFIETKWGTVKNYFPEALVFTNSSIVNSKESTGNIEAKDIEDGESVYGILDKRVKNSEIHIFKYEEFENEIKLYESRINTENIFVIGSANHHFITSFINDTNDIYSPIQNEFPIIMKDNNGNHWNVFGIATSGSRKGQQLKSPIGFVALWWAWEAFYDDFVFND